MKRVVKKLVEKVAPKKTDDLLELAPAFLRVVRAFEKTSQPWLPLAKEALSVRRIR